MTKAKPKTEVKLNFPALAGGVIIVVCAMYGVKYSKDYTNLIAVFVAFIGAYLIWRS